MICQTLGAWVHTLSPYIADFGGGLGLRWYGVSYALGFVVGWAWLRWMSKRGLTPLSPLRITDAMLYLMIGVVAGGRVGYVLFYEPTLLWSFSKSIPWWGLLQLNKGGMSSHGGMIGVIVASWFIARGVKDKSGTVRQRVPWRHVIDLMSLTCTPGLMFGRLANFINGELLGKIVAMPGEASPWWSVKYPQEVLSGHRPILTPEQAAGLDRVLEQVRRADTDHFDLLYERFVAVIQRGGASGERFAAQLEPYLAARHPTQLYQAVTEGLVVAAALWWIWRKPRLPGVIGSWFLIIYGVIRILNELFRLPDANLGTQLGLSRGQWLSVLMIGVGSVALTLVIRRGGDKFGGWAKGVKA